VQRMLDVAPEVGHVVAPFGGRMLSNFRRSGWPCCFSSGSHNPQMSLQLQAVADGVPRLGS
jgi:hypothetical protein